MLEAVSPRHCHPTIGTVITYVDMMSHRTVSRRSLAIEVLDGHAEDWTVTSRMAGVRDVDAEAEGHRGVVGESTLPGSSTSCRRAGFTPVKHVNRFFGRLPDGCAE